MKRQIVCLANSRKPDGKCLAGKALDDNSWIRPPVSRRPNDSLSATEECVRGNDCRCGRCNPIVPSLLDIIEVDLTDYAGYAHQTENYYISDNKWKKVGVLPFELLKSYVDTVPGGLWINGFGTNRRKNDRVPAHLGSGLKNSLCLINVLNLSLTVVLDGVEYGHPRKRVYGSFYYYGTEYIIPVTDEVVENRYIKQGEGTYTYPTVGKNIILCLSLGQEWNGYIYKFIAGVIAK